MDSIAQVKAALTAFLADQEPGVIAIKGDWGVGKTFLWGRFIAEQQAVKGYSGYSYASLFGASSLAEVRTALFDSQVSIGSASMAALARKFDIVARKGSTALVKLTKPAGSQNTDHLSGVFQDKALRNIVVCLDDLERKEDSVTGSALLGFITNFRDERRCKVVLLYNEAKTNEAFSATIAEYREKVIDHEVLLDPSVAQCYKIIFGDGKFDKLAAPRAVSTAARGDDRTLLQIFESAKVANIRLLRRSRSILEYLRPHLQSKYPNQWPVIARQAVKLCFLHFKHAQFFQVEEIADQTKWIRLIMDKKKEGPGFERNKKIFAEVERIGYQPDKTDQMVIDFIRFGFVDWDEYKGLLEQLESEVASVKVQAEWRATWDKLWDNFHTPAADVLTGLRAFLRKHKATLSLNQVSTVVVFLREYAPDPADEAILTEKIEAFAKVYAASEPHSRSLMGLDTSVAKRVIAQSKASRGVKSINEVMENMTRVGGWNPAEAEYLRKTTKADFVAWLKSEARADFLGDLAEFRGRLDSDAVGRSVLKKLDGALRQVGKRSPLDRRRVRYGAKLEPKPKKSASKPPPAST
jgi:hypothetical protein